VVQLRCAAVGAFPGVETEKRSHFQTKESCPPDAAQPMAMADYTYHALLPHSVDLQQKSGKTEQLLIHQSTAQLEVERNQLVVRSV
jgi:hypothetical protein